MEKQNVMRNLWPSLTKSNYVPMRRDVEAIEGIPLEDCEGEETIDEFPMTQSNIEFQETEGVVLKPYDGEIDQKVEKVACAFVSAGFSFPLFPDLKSEDLAYDRYGKDMENLGPIKYDGDIVVKMSFPDVGNEYLTTRYSNSMGVYTRKEGVIAANNVSNIIYCAREWIEGQEYVYFSLRTNNGKSYTFEWRDKIRFICYGEYAACMKIAPNGLHYIRSGKSPPGVKSTHVAWEQLSLPLCENSCHGIEILMDGVPYIISRYRRFTIDVEKGYISGTTMTTKFPEGRHYIKYEDGDFKIDSRTNHMAENVLFSMSGSWLLLDEFMNNVKISPHRNLFSPTRVQFIAKEKKSILRAKLMPVFMRGLQISKGNAFIEMIKKKINEDKDYDPNEDHIDYRGVSFVGNNRVWVGVNIFQLNRQKLNSLTVFKVYGECARTSLSYSLKKFTMSEYKKEVHLQYPRYRTVVCSQ